MKTTTAPATTTETRFVYNASGTLAAEYGPGESESDTEYFMADHLGSTRLVTSSTGVPKRAFDYLPFGEEIPQGVSGRGALYPLDGATPASGKKFTGKERDQETGLDYFGARYLGAVQGRFISPDPLLNSGRPWEPQSWNRYLYAANNPLKFIDPTGLYEWDASFGGSCTDRALSRGECSGFDKKQGKAVVNDRKSFRKQHKKLGNSSDASLRADASAIGQENVDNGVTVSRHANLPPGIAARVSFDVPLSVDSNGNPELNLQVSVGAGGDSLFIALAHEGSHLWDAQAVADGRQPRMLHFETEVRGFLETIRAAQTLGRTSVGPSGGPVFWDSSWTKVDQQTRPPKEIMRFLLTSPVYAPKAFRPAYVKP